MNTIAAIIDLKHTFNTLVDEIQKGLDRVTVLEEERDELKRRIKEVRAERDTLSELDPLSSKVADHKAERDNWKYLADEHAGNARALRVELDAAKNERDAWKAIVQECGRLLDLDLRKSPGADCNVVTNAIRALQERVQKAEKAEAVYYKLDKSTCPFAPEFVLPGIVKQFKEAQEKEPSKTPPGFTCPKCGGHDWGASLSGGAQQGAFGHCHGIVESGGRSTDTVESGGQPIRCGFTWPLPDPPEEG